MREKTAKFLMIFLQIFLVGCAKDINEGNQVLISNGKNLIKVNVEIADDNNEREKGLMFRERLNEDEGMLFVFDDDAVRVFWMKNTLIPLDIIFIDGNFDIVGIKRATPCKAEPCELYESSRPAKYVLEVNGNFTEKNSISVGDKIIVSKNSLKQINNKPNKKSRKTKLYKEAYQKPLLFQNAGCKVQEMR